MSKFVVTVIINDKEVDVEAFNSVEAAEVKVEEINKRDPEKYPTIVLK